MKFPFKQYNLKKRSHRYALLHDVELLECLIRQDFKRGWQILDLLLADVLLRGASISASTSNRILLGLHIGGVEQRTMDKETSGIEALWTLAMLLDPLLMNKRPILSAFNRAVELWLRGYSLNKTKDIEYGPLLAVAWMTLSQRQKLMSLILDKEDKKTTDIREPQKIMGAQYLLGFEPLSWDQHEYIAASHGVQQWMERIFFQVAPAQCTWIKNINPLIGEWFPMYWAATKEQPLAVRKNSIMRGLEQMTFPVDAWYSWWSWHALVTSQNPCSKTHGYGSIVTMPSNGVYPRHIQPLTRHKKDEDFPLDLLTFMSEKHSSMDIAFSYWAPLAACTISKDSGDIKWVHRMWEMHKASLLKTPQLSLDIVGLLD